MQNSQIAVLGAMYSLSSTKTYKIKMNALTVQNPHHKRLEN